MGLNLGMKSRTRVQCEQTRLTEENLRLHSCTRVKSDSACDLREAQRWASVPEPYNQFDDDYDGSDDGDMDTSRSDIAFRRAASLEALKAYGGCFASGFLAMQDPLPWTSRRSGHTTRPFYENAECLDLQKLASEMASNESQSAKTTSSHSHSNAGCPRPDSDTLSHADIQSLKNERKWSWRSIGKKRRNVVQRIV
ncbi:uncharacterized protein K460DRAFT_353832 [Cucurbitaria berberidis CBS 394.84]|uniref:Uncharacterized protein n=1 Tax=Cucurbitaria berberidis CBS 394.84 TaxID=1168544 RepID=A0A9P4LC83_9PLEO|nr:uncharacterized protein K460DRAFT_353832 [Cucurbitaria berberidis CBS 394.84]KAF1848899.1 hypothetical protein K460DRAFT_353832 [Cucurbitaria berberidis CBS 394.84]